MSGNLLLPAVASGMPQINTVYCCDALAFLRAIPDGCLDMGISSPPYDGLRDYKGYSFNFEPIAHQMYRCLKPGGVWVWVVNDSVINGSETLTSFRQALYFKDVVGFRLHDTMIWHKDGAPFPESNRYLQTFEYMFVLSKGSPVTHNISTERTKYGASRTCSGRNTDGSIDKFKYEIGKEFRRMDNLWYVPSGYNKTTKDPEAFKHPAMFPEELARRHITTWSNPGDIVCDIFMGSGTTAKIARANDRRWVGCDISQEYVNLAKDRLASTDPFQHRKVTENIVQQSLFAANS